MDFLVANIEAIVFYTVAVLTVAGGIGGRFIPDGALGIDYALIPTTAYHPRWFMHYPHMDTAEAITAM